jgi:hypothetical protein
LLNKFQKADNNSSELEAQKYHNFFFKLIEYSHKYCNIKNIEDTKLLVEFLSHFIDLTSSQESYKGESIAAKTVI